MKNQVIRNCLILHFLILPNKEPSGLHNTRLTETDGSLTMDAWIWPRSMELRHSDDRITILPNDKLVRKEHTFNTIELAPISHTWKLLEANFSLELTSHKLMSPIAVPTEKTPYKYK